MAWKWNSVASVVLSFGVGEDELFEAFPINDCSVTISKLTIGFFYQPKSSCLCIMALVMPTPST